MSKLEVTKIEFEFTKKTQSIGYYFYESLKKYASKALAKVNIYCEDKKVIFELEKPISINTVNKAVVALLKQTHIEIDEIEYKPKERKVEIEIE